MQDLKITLIQTSLYWQDAESNRKMLDSKIPDKGFSDLIVLPEMFTTGFSMESKILAEAMNGKTIQWMLHHSARTQASLAGSLIIYENNQYYNRFILANPDGSLYHYNKRHLFRMAGEDAAYTPGVEKSIIDIKGWKICPMICYDLRFPVWSRNQNNYDCLIYVANWPAPRKNAWKALLVARAIENNAYVIGVNRTGQDGKGHQYEGDSAAIDMLGQSLWQGGQTDAVTTITLSADNLRECRKKFPWHLDADNFKLLL